MKLIVCLLALAMPVLGALAVEPPMDVTTQIKTAHILRRQGLEAAAREIFLHVVADPAASAYAKSEAQVWLGHLLRNEGKLDAAVEAYSKVLFLPGANPHHHSEATVSMAQIHFKLGDYARAKREFSVVLTLPARVSDHLRQAEERLAQIERLTTRRAGLDLDAIRRRLPESITPISHEQLENAVPLSYYFDYHAQPQPGQRRWKRIDPLTWHEIYPNGQTTVFKVLGHTRIEDTEGTIVVKTTGRFEQTATTNDGGLQAFIPDKGSAQMRHWYRNQSRGDTAWNDLGEMKDVQ